MEKSP